MKPYKIMSSKTHNVKKAKLVGILKPPKVPLYFFKNCHTPPKANITKLD